LIKQRLLEFFIARRAGLQPAAPCEQQNNKLTRTASIPTTPVRTARVLPARTTVLKKVNSIHKQPHIKPSRSLYKSLHSKQEQRGPSSNKRVGAASPPPGSGSSGFARASCALWRARPCGLNQIRPPSKTQAFLGRPNFANARGVVRKPPEGPLGWF